MLQIYFLYQNGVKLNAMGLSSVSQQSTVNYQLSIINFQHF